MTPRVHTYVSTEPLVRPNAFIIESDAAIVIVDTTLTMSDSLGVKQLAAGLGKPVAGILLTHGHPDHVAGTTSIAPDGDVPIVALRSVHDLMKASEQVKHQQWSAMFGDQWIPRWVYPNTIVKDGETVHLAGLDLTVVDLGPGGDSDANSIWLLQNGSPAAFVGDFIFNNHHTYMADGGVLRWIANLDRFGPLLATYTSIYVGHGPSSDASSIARQKDYLTSACTCALEATGGTAVFTDDSRKRYEAMMLAKYPDYGFRMTVAFSADALGRELTGVRSSSDLQR